MRGRFIAIEGLDRSGKSTQCDRLVAHLTETTGHKTHLFKFPDRSTPMGQIINQYLTSGVALSDQAIHLLFSANRWERIEDIKALLEKGENVVLDRYYISGIVYTQAKGLERQWCTNPDLGLPVPDITLFLTVSPEVASQRGAYGEERYEKIAFQKRVAELFHEVAQRNCITVDASGSQEEVARAINQCVETVQIGEELEKFNGL